MAYWRERALPTTVVRLFNTVGPRQTGSYGMVVPRLVGQALAGEPLTVYGDGHQTRCFCHVADVVQALFGLMAEESAYGNVFNVGTTAEISILDLARRIIAVTGSDSDISLIPYDEAYGEGFEDMYRRVPDIAKVQALIGWRPTRWSASSDHGRESVTIFGNLTCPAGEAVGRQVAIYQRAANRSGFVLLGNATTVATMQANTGGVLADSAGVRSEQRLLRDLSGCEKRASGDQGRPGCHPTTPSTPVDGAQLFTGGGRLHRAQNTVTFTGKVSPIAAGAVVALQRENAPAKEEWHRIAPLGRVDKNGEYSITHTFAVPGDASIRVVVHPRSRLNVGAASTPASYEISQAENPQLTIESTADPLTWGHSTTLKGLVKGAAPGTHLTLLARPRGGQFAPVATTGTTGSEAPTPSRSRRCRTPPTR